MTKCNEYTLILLNSHKLVGLAVLNGLVYAVGGFNGSLRVRMVDVYDPSKDSWSSVASMEARRSTLGVGVLNGLVYAVGGFDGSTGLNSAECYNIQTNEWRLISPMTFTNIWAWSKSLRIKIPF